MDIVSGIIIGAVVMIGIWCIWYENHGTSNHIEHNEDKEDEDK